MSLLPFSSLSMDYLRGLVLGAWQEAQAKRSPGNGRDSWPLVQIVPVKPLHRHYHTPASTGSLSDGENLNRFSPAVVWPEELWQRQRVGKFSGDECQTGPGSLLVRPMLGASYNERHLKRARTHRRKVFPQFESSDVNTVKCEVEWDVSCRQEEVGARIGGIREHIRPDVN